MLYIGRNVVDDSEEGRIHRVQVPLACGHESMNGLRPSVVLVQAAGLTNRNQIICIGASESGDANGLRESILCLELHVQAPSKIWLDTHCLENEDTHSDHPLFGSIIPVLHCIKKAENYKIVRAVRVDNERPEPFVALQGLPEENEHLRCPFDRPLATGQVRIGRSHLPSVRKWSQNPRMDIQAGSEFWSCHQQGIESPGVDVIVQNSGDSNSSAATRDHLPELGIIRERGGTADSR